MEQNENYDMQQVQLAVEKTQKMMLVIIGITTFTAIVAFACYYKE